MILYLASVLFAVLTHEAAHLTVMRALGVKTERMRFGGFGIAIEAKYGLASYLKQAAVSLSGSACNIISAHLLSAHGELSAACLAYGLFNLLPLSMLDGGELLDISLAACGTTDRARRIVHTAADTVLTAAIWIFAVYLALNGVGEGLLISSLYMVFSRLFNRRT